MPKSLTIMLLSDIYCDVSTTASASAYSHRLSVARSVTHCVGCGAGPNVLKEEW